jgi:hypothetical protein
MVQIKISYLCSRILHFGTGCSLPSVLDYVVTFFKGQIHDEDLDVHPLKMRPPCDLRTSHNEQPVMEHTVPEE